MPINQKQFRLIALVVLLLLISALFILGHQPWSGSLFPAPWDKGVHFLFYGTIAVLLGLAFRPLSLPAILLIALAVGCADEFHQLFVPGRHAGFDDLAADFVGIFMALFLIPRLRRLTSALPFTL